MYTLFYTNPWISQDSRLFCIQWRTTRYIRGIVIQASWVTSLSHFVWRGNLFTISWFSRICFIFLSALSWWLHPESWCRSSPFYWIIHGWYHSGWIHNSFNANADEDSLLIEINASQHNVYRARKKRAMERWEGMWRFVSTWILVRIYYFGIHTLFR